MGTRLAAGAYIGIAVYCLLSLTLGPMGTASYRDLELQVRSMRENLETLESLNAEAAARRDAALSDPEALALEARSLGYVEPDKVVVRLGFPAPSRPARDPGTLVPYTRPRGMADTQMKAASLAAALCAALCAAFAGFLVRPGIQPRRKSRRNRDFRASQIHRKNPGRRMRSNRAYPSSSSR